MGLFLTHTFTGGQWVDGVEEVPPYFGLQILDSDIATIVYSPAPDTEEGYGVAYLGVQPRVYFEDPEANGPVELDARADGLAVWANQYIGSSVKPEDIRPLLAEDNEDDPVDTFVEDTVITLLGILGLPLPDALNFEGPEE